MSTITKLSQDVTQYYEYYITDRRKCENTKRYTSMNSIKDAHKLQKRKLKSLVGDLEGKDSGRSVDDPRFHCASLISKQENPQALESGHGI